MIDGGYLIGAAMLVVLTFAFGGAAVRAAYTGLKEDDLGLFISAAFMSLFWFWGPLWIFFSEPGLLIGGVLALGAFGYLFAQEPD